MADYGHFKVTFPDRSVAFSGSYKLWKSGVLNLVPDDGNPVLYAPNAWISLEFLDGPQSI